MIRAGFLLALALSAAAQDVKLTGRVIDASTGAGIPSATVHLTPLGPVHRFDVTVQVNASGGFEAQLPPTGSVIMEARASGFVPVGTFSIASLRLEDRAASVTLKMTRNSAITGKVVDADTGKPIAALQVSAAEVTWYHGQRDLLISGKSAVTGPDGVFLIRNLTASEYALDVNSAPFAPGALLAGPMVKYSRIYWPGGGGRQTVSALPVAPGATFDAGAIRLRVSDSPWLSVKVAGADCRPRQVYEIELTAYSGRSVINYGKWDAPCGGKTAAVRVGAGEYTLRALATSQPDGLREQGAVTVRVADRDLEVTVPVTAPVTVRGKLSMEESAGALSASQPLPATLRVKLWPRGSDATAIISPVSSATPVSVAADGSFASYSYIPPGGQIVTEISGLPNSYVSKIRYNGIEADGDMFILNPQAAQQDIEIVCSDRAANISGTVRNNANQPVVQAQVLLAPWPPPLAANYPLGVAERTVDASGGYSFSGLRPGKYRAIAVAEADRQTLEQPGKLLPLLTSADTIDVTEQRTAIANLRPTSPQ